MHITCFFLVKSKRDLRYCKVWFLYAHSASAVAKTAISIKMLNQEDCTVSPPWGARAALILVSLFMTTLSGQ